jgi:hypothetical protein
MLDWWLGQPVHLTNPYGGLVAWTTCLPDLTPMVDWWLGQPVHLT